MLGLQLLPVWCASGARWPRTLALVLHCATKLSARLQAAAREAVPEPKRAAELRQPPFLASLRAHLHRGATAQVRRMHHRCWTSCQGLASDRVTGKKLSMVSFAMYKAPLAILSIDFALDCWP